MPGLSDFKNAVKIAPLDTYPGKLIPVQFVSSVDNAQNSWRAELNSVGDNVRIRLKLGEWGISGSQAVDTIWIANRINWAEVKKYGRDLEWTYTFGESSIGVKSILKFGASVNSAHLAEGDCSLTLIYGQNDCVFRRGDDSTSGQLPFKITSGTTVRIRIKSEKSVDIWINDQPILANQAVNLESNFISIIATTGSPALPQLLEISSLEAALIR